jgi:hypothetical protein
MNSIRMSARLSLCEIINASVLEDEEDLLRQNMTCILGYLQSKNQSWSSLQYSLNNLYVPPEPTPESEISISDACHFDEQNFRQSELCKSFRNCLGSLENGGFSSKRTVWDEMVTVCLKFLQSRAFLPEEQFRGRLWSPILESAICGNQNSYLFL